MAGDLGFIPQVFPNYSFISYNNADAERIVPIVKDLLSAHIPLWYDAGLSGGEDWKKRVSLRIADAECRGMIFFFSEAILKKKSYALTEYDIAKVHKKHIIVYSLEPFKLDALVRKYPEFSAFLVEIGDTHIIESPKALIAALKAHGVSPIKPGKKPTGEKTPAPKKPTSHAGPSLAEILRVDGILWTNFNNPLVSEERFIEDARNQLKAMKSIPAETLFGAELKFPSSKLNMIISGELRKVVSSPAPAPKPVHKPVPKPAPKPAPERMQSPDPMPVPHVSVAKSVDEYVALAARLLKGDGEYRKGIFNKVQMFHLNLEWAIQNPKACKILSIKAIVHSKSEGVHWEEVLGKKETGIHEIREEARYFAGDIQVDVILEYKIRAGSKTIQVSLFADPHSLN